MSRSAPLTSKDQVGVDPVGGLPAHHRPREPIQTLASHPSPPRSVMPTVNVELGRLLGEELRRHGVQVVTDVTAKAIGHQHSRLAASGEPDLTAAAGVVLVVVGVRPDPGSRWPLAWRPGCRGGCGSTGGCGPTCPMC